MKKEINAFEIKNAIRVGAIDENLNNLRGRVLTVIDASISDIDQKKAIKDLIHSEFDKKISWIYEMGHADVTQKEIDKEYQLSHGDYRGCLIKLED